MLKCNKVLAAFILSQFATVSQAEAATVKGEHLFTVFGLPVTNSMLTTWVFAAIIIVLFRLLIPRGARLIPGKGQLVIESMIDGLKGIFEPLMGEKAFRAAFPLLLGFFAYILIMNWSGLIPGVGSIGQEQVAMVPQAEVQQYAANGFAIDSNHEAEAGKVAVSKFVPYIRPANTDLNTTLALAMISFGAWIYYVLRFAGFKAFVVDTFGNKADKKDVGPAMYLSLFVVFFAVGCIDLISIIMRLLSLSFRLFGNTFGGEVLLENMHQLSFGLPEAVSWVLPLPFYLLELLIGLIQAFLFTLLTAVYIGLLTNHDEGHTESEG